MKQTVLNKIVQSEDTFAARKRASVPDTGALLFEDKVPDFAQSAFNAVRKVSPWPEKEDASGHKAPHIHTYAVMENGMASTIIFFQRERRKITVLNEQATLEGKTTQQFAHYVFGQFPRIRLICFRTHESYIQRSGWFTGWGKKEDTRTVVLPHALTQQWEDATHFNRRRINYFIQRLRQDYPDAYYETQSEHAIDAQQCRAILQLNRVRTAGHPEADEPLDEEAEQLIRSAQKSGLIGIISIRGKIAAGVIGYRVGPKVHLRLLSQDPRFKAYGLSMLCCYFTICACIDRGTRAKRPLEGRAKYRYALIRRQREFTPLMIYRPCASWLIRCDHALYSSVMDMRYRLMAFRDDCVQVGTSFIRLARACKTLLQAAKRKGASFAWRDWPRPSFLRGQ